MLISPFQLCAGLSLVQGFSLLRKGAISPGITVKLWLGVSGVTASTALGRSLKCLEALCSRPQSRDFIHPVVGLRGLSGMDSLAHSRHSAGLLAVPPSPQSLDHNAGFPAGGDLPGRAGVGVTQGSEHVLNIQPDPRASPRPVPSVACL